MYLFASCSESMSSLHVCLIWWESCASESSSSPNCLCDCHLSLLVMRPWVNGGWQLAASLQGSSRCMWPPCNSIRKQVDNNHHLPVTCLLEGRIGTSLLIMFIKSCVVSLPGRSSTLIRHVICLCHIHYNLISVGESSNFSNGHTRETYESCK